MAGNLIQAIYQTSEMVAVGKPTRTTKGGSQMQYLGLEHEIWRNIHNHKVVLVMQIYLKLLVHKKIQAYM
jgi:hypothetical protein